MTYCCALRLEQGLVFISDTRTNAGVDHISVFRKLHTFGVTGERFIALQTAGNLATTQAVIGHLQNALILQQEPNLYSINTMFEVADLVGKTLKSVLEDISSDTQEQMNYACSILVGDKLKAEICSFIMFIRKAILFAPPQIRLTFKLVKVNMANLF